MATEITAENFEKEVKHADKPVLIDFWAPWCGPCKMMGPVFEELSKEMADVKFVKVNTDEESDVAVEFGVSSIPTLVLVKNGEEKDRLTGFLPKEVLKQKIQNMLNA